MNKHIPKEWCRKCSCLCSQFQTTSYFVFSDGSWGCLFHSVFPFENSFKTQATTTGFTKWRKIQCLLLIYNLPFAQNSFCVIVSLFRQWEGCLNVFYRSFPKTTGYCRGAIFKKNFKIEDTFTTFFTITFCFKFRFPYNAFVYVPCFIKISFPNFDDITVIGCLLSYIEMFVSAYANSDYAEHDISLCYVGMLWSLLSFPAILGTRIQHT